ncbi:hypothetical protein [Parvularcula sp. LCG005]|uniref:hypothetical protein n=1 Tax=Parvularcula sp. LCG005 TaxID=3078805 RepID=UPI00294201E1|nr:hypothetical protein [Parvularcula sp. LCG005]WOI53833.1 hypothetical protein RUI03_02255 [Parvularcula sp. LCG005]
MAKAAVAPTYDEAGPAVDQAKPSPKAPQETLNIDAQSAALSPARRMQETLGREFGDAAEAIEPWPIRRTVAFVIFACGAFWTAVYFAVAAIAG